MYLNSGESSNEIHYSTISNRCAVKRRPLLFRWWQRFIFAVAYGADAQFGYPLPGQCLFDGIGP